MKHPKTLVSFVLIAAISALSLNVFNSCSQESQGQDKYIGLQLYSLRDTMPKAPEATIKNVADMGYAFVEPAGYSEGKFYGMEPKKFKKVVNDAGMDIISSHTGQALPDSSEWDETMEWWDKCIKAHKEAGIKYIVQPWMGEKAYQSLDTLQRYCEYFNKIGEKCNAQGIKFGYHNHDAEFNTELEGKTVYDYMLNNTDPDKVLFQIDLYWANEGGADPVNYFKEYPGRFELWHVKDEKEVGASGDMDFKKYFKHTDKAGMKYQIVEVEEYNYSPLKSVEKSLEFLQNADFVKADYSK